MWEIHHPYAGRGSGAFWPYYVVCRGFLTYAVVSTLGIGDTLTVDLSGLDETPVWAGVNVHAATNLTGYLSAVAASAGSHTDNLNWTNALTGNPLWKGLIGGIFPTPWIDQTLGMNVSDGITRYTTIAADIPPDSAFPGGSIAFYDLQASSSPDCKIMYGIANIDLTYSPGYSWSGSGALNVFAEPRAYLQGPGAPWHDSSETADDYFMWCNGFDVWGATAGVAEGGCFRPQIYRRVR